MSVSRIILPHTDVAQDLGTDPVIPEVHLGRRQTRSGAVHRRAALTTIDIPGDRIRLAFQIENNPRAGRRYLFHRGAQQPARVALGVAEDVAGQVLAMGPHEHRPLGRDLPHQQHEMLALVDPVAIDARLELATDGGQARLGDRFDHRLVAEPVFDDIGDGDNLEPVDRGELDQIVAPRHRAVIFQNLADHAGRLHAREPGEVDSALGLTGADQHPAVARAERIDVAGRDKLAAGRVLAHRLQNSGRPILRRDARAHRAPRRNRHCEGGPERRLIVPYHHVQPELVDPLAGHRQADQPAAELGHEIDRFGGSLFGRHAKVAFVLPILVVHQDDDAAPARLFEGFLDSDKRGNRVVDTRSNFTKHRLTCLRPIAMFQTGEALSNQTLL